jgi:hypothetical protein
MLTFCFTCHAYTVGKCSGANHPGQCPKHNSRQAQQAARQEIREVTAVS